MSEIERGLEWAGGESSEPLLRPYITGVQEGTILSKFTLGSEDNPTFVALVKFPRSTARFVPLRRETGFKESDRVKVVEVTTYRGLEKNSVSYQVHSLDYNLKPKPFTEKLPISMQALKRTLGQQPNSGANQAR